MPENPAASDDLPLLDITCTSTDCENGFHCFLQSKKLLEQNDGRKCRTCGVDLVDWGRIYKRDVADAEYTFRTLQYELIRHHYWHVPIDQRAVNYALRKGKLGLRFAAERRLWQAVGSGQPFHDGIQTPRAGNILYYAQHATATCCRRCIEAWHGVPIGRQLTQEEVSYFADLMMLYVDSRLLDLGDQGIKVPPIRTKRVNRNEGSEDADID